MPVYMFDVGNSGTGPIGFVARVQAATPEAALVRLRELLPEGHAWDTDESYGWDLPFGSDGDAKLQLEPAEYVAVYFNGERVTEQDLDLDETNEDEVTTGKELS